MRFTLALVALCATLLQGCLGEIWSFATSLSLHCHLP
jgi:hypothetical protein